MATMAATAPPAEVPAGDKTGCLMMAMMTVFLTVLVYCLAKCVWRGAGT
jgi:hypothetical protein